MKFRFYLKRFLKKLYFSLKKKKIASRIHLAYSEKNNSFFDPYIYKNKLLISDRNEKCLREFLVSQDYSLKKTDVTYKKKSIKTFEDINRGTIIEYDNYEYLVFTYQFNGRSIIIKTPFSDYLSIKENDIFINTTEYYEKMSVMNPFIFVHKNKLYCFYSAGETYEPDCICLAKIVDFKNNIVEKYPFNPIFVNNTRYFYRYQKVAFGDLLLYKNYYLLFYIGYYNVDKAYINLAYSTYDDFPNFEDVDNVNPIISPTIKLDAVYKPSVVIEDKTLIVYFNGRRKNREAIYFVKIKIDTIMKEIIKER